ncbi:MAG: helix-turn-helix domain-containing protein [Clostridia bacterium]|nr:helix-turn-helix domain-containing protein [Clostridia bacterium]
MIGIGELLRQAREEQQLSLADVERETKIRSRYLEALEAEQFDILPGTVYLFGFVRSYASFLGLDAEELVSLLKKQYQSDQELQVEATPLRSSVYVPKTRRTGRILKLLAVVLAVFLVAAYSYQYYLGKVSTEQPIAPVQGPEESPTEPFTPEIEEETDPAAVTAGIELVVSVVDRPGARCWVEIRSDGVVDYSGTLEAGDSRVVTADEKVWLKIGNAGVLSIVYNGEDLGSLGAEGEVVTLEFSLPLKPEGTSSP